MALKLGELVTFLRADDDQFQKSLKQSKKDWKEHGDHLKDSAKVAGLAIGVALGAGVIGALGNDKITAKLGAQLGATGADAQRYGQIAGNLYKDGWGASIQDLATTVRSVMQSGLIDRGAATADIQAVAQSAQTLADTFDMDVTAAARAAGQMVKTGLAANAQEAFDILTRGFQETGDLAGDLLDSFDEYSTQFRKLGLSGAEAMGLMAQGSKNGARDLDVVADALKEFAIRSADGSKASAAGFEAIGLNAKKMTGIFAAGGPKAREALDMVLTRIQAMKDPTDREAAAIGLFGTKAEDLQAALMDMDLDTAAAGLGKIKGATDEAGKALGDTAGAKLDTFKRKAQQALVEKMAAAIPVIEKVVGWLERNKAVMDPLITVLGVLAGIIGLIVVATKTWTAVQVALNVAMMLNPIGLIVLAVIALIAIFVVLWVKFAGFREFWIATWEVIKGAALAVWDFLVAAFQVWWAVFSGFWIGVGDFFVGLWGGIVSGVKSAWKWITDTFDKVVGFVTGLPGRIGKAASGMWNGIKDAFRAAINWMIGKWNSFSLTIGGGTIMGVHIPSVRLDTPDIPMLKDGGVVRATPGGRMVGVAEGGEDEAVAPLSKLAGMIDDALQRRLASADRGPSGDLVVMVDGEVIERRSLAAIQRNPVEVALASKTGSKRIAYAGI